MRLTVMICVSVLALTACNEEMESPPPSLPGIDEVVVFERGPHVRQCGPVAVTRTQSAAKLTGAGIEVRRSGCGQVEGEFYATVCGAPTSEILLHDIPVLSLAAARGLGFEDADELNDGRGRVWRRRSCPQYLHAIELAQTETTCANLRNRVFFIQSGTDNNDRVTLLDQAGSCSDANFRQILFGAAGDDVLCSNADSIAGPRKTCPAPGRAAMFDTIIANLNRPDLGLGAGYYVGQIFPTE